MCVTSNIAETYTCGKKVGVSGGQNQVRIGFGSAPSGFGLGKNESEYNPNLQTRPDPIRSDLIYIRIGSDRVTKSG